MTLTHRTSLSSLLIALSTLIGASCTPSEQYGGSDFLASKIVGGKIPISQIQSVRLARPPPDHSEYPQLFGGIAYDFKNDPPLPEVAVTTDEFQSLLQDMLLSEKYYLEAGCGFTAPPHPYDGEFEQMHNEKQIAEAAYPHHLDLLKQALKKGDIAMLKTVTNDGHYDFIFIAVTDSGSFFYVYSCNYDDFGHLSQVSDALIRNLLERTVVRPVAPLYPRFTEEEAQAQMRRKYGKIYDSVMEYVRTDKAVTDALGEVQYILPAQGKNEVLTWMDQSATFTLIIKGTISEGIAKIRAGDAGVCSMEGYLSANGERYSLSPSKKCSFR